MAFHAEPWCVRICECDQEDALCAINKSLYAENWDSSSINQWSGGNLRSLIYCDIEKCEMAIFQIDFGCGRPQN